MKRKIALALVAAMTICMVGCGSETATAEQETTVEETAVEETEESETTEEATEETADETKDTEEGKTYIISCDQAFAPFAIQQDDGSYTGIDVELLDAIAKAGGFEYELQPMDFSGIIPALVSGTIDGGMACMNITEERKESVDFSDPYYESGVALVCRADDDSISTKEDLSGKIAACKEGSIGQIWCEDNAETYGYEVTVYPDSASMMMAVTNGQADFLFEDYPTVSYQIKIGEQAGLRVAIDAVDEVGEVGFAVKKDTNGELLEKFNAGLAAIKADGTYDEIISEYE